MFIKIVFFFFCFFRQIDSLKNFALYERIVVWLHPILDYISLKFQNFWGFCHDYDCYEKYCFFSFQKHSVEITEIFFYSDFM